MSYRGYSRNVKGRTFKNLCFLTINTTMVELQISCKKTTI